MSVIPFYHASNRFLENLTLIVRRPIASQLANSDANAQLYTNCLFTAQIFTELVPLSYGIYGSLPIIGNYDINSVRNET